MTPIRLNDTLLSVPIPLFLNQLQLEASATNREIVTATLGGQEACVMSAYQQLAVVSSIILYNWDDKHP